MPKKKLPDKFDFTKSYEELEQIVADFETKEIDLAKDLPRFERGLELARLLQARLKEINNTVVTIEKKFTDEE